MRSIKLDMQLFTANLLPLELASQPEKRRYRLCYWDGNPTRVWSPVIEVVFGG